MQSDVETVAEIIREMFEYPKSWGEYNHLNWKALAKRIKEAHDHELDVQYGRISRLVDKLIAKDAEIAGLREKMGDDDLLKMAKDIDAKNAEIAKLRTLTTHTDNSEVIAELQRRLKVAEDALEKCVNYNNAWELETAEENAMNALAAIRGEGGEK